MGHCELPKPEPAPAAPKPSCTAEHAAMGHCKLEERPAPAASSCRSRTRPTPRAGPDSIASKSSASTAAEKR